MRLLVDAQLPRRLAALLSSLGHDVVHTMDLSDGNQTVDEGIIRLADSDRRIVVNKDPDFLDSHLRLGQPRMLLLVSTGNISNGDLMRLFAAGADRLATAFESSALAELHRTAVVVHR